MDKKRYIFDKTLKGINQKYGELVALCGGFGPTFDNCIVPFYNSELWTVTRLADRIKKRLPG